MRIAYCASAILGKPLIRNSLGAGSRTLCDRADQSNPTELPGIYGRAWAEAPKTNEVSRGKRADWLWTAEAVKTLKQLRAHGTPLADVRKKHFPGRTYGAIARKCKELGIGAFKLVRWTKEEDRLLREAKADGLGWPEILTTLPRRSYSSVARRWRIISQEMTSETARDRGKAWTAEDILLLKHMKDVEKAPWEEISQRLGRSYHAVRGAYREKLNPGSRGKKWTAEELARVRTLTAEGNGNREIAIALQRSPAAIEHVLTSMYAAEPNLRRRTVWRPEDERRLALVAKNNRSAAELSALFPDIPRSMIYRKLRQLRKREAS